MKNEALEVLKNRRSIRQYKPQQIAPAELDAVLEAGTYAPTGGGRQSPVIVAVQDPATVAALNKLNAKVMGDESAQPYYGAPTILVVFAPQDASTPVEDGSCVLDHMLCAAYAAGLGSCWIARPKEMFELPEGKELMKKWGLADNMMGIGSVALGYADGPAPEVSPRKVGYVIRV